MSILYFGAFCGVCLVLLAILFETVRNVTKKPVWSERAAYQPIEKSLIQPLDLRPVEPRHSGFAGLTNEEEWHRTA